MSLPAFCNSHKELADFIYRTGEATVRLEERLRAQSKTLDKLDDKLDNLPLMISKAVEGHASGCLARKRALNRASQTTSIGPPPPPVIPILPVAPPPPPVASNPSVISLITNGGVVIPKWVIWVGAFIGTVIGAAYAYSVAS